MSEVIWDTREPEEQATCQAKHYPYNTKANWRYNNSFCKWHTAFETGPVSGKGPQGICR